MSIQIKFSNSSKKSFIAKIDSFPAIVKVPASPKDYMSHFAMGLFFTIFGYSLFSSNLGEATLTPNLFLGLAFGSYGGYSLARILKSSKGSATMTFHKTYVEVKEELWFRNRKWQTRYSDFKGLQIRTAKSTKDTSLEPYQIIELIHEDKTKTLPLYAKRGSIKPQSIMENYEKILNLLSFNKS